MCLQFVLIRIFGGKNHRDFIDNNQQSADSETNDGEMLRKLDAFKHFTYFCGLRFCRDGNENAIYSRRCHRFEYIIQRESVHVRDAVNSFPDYYYYFCVERVNENRKKWKRIGMSTSKLITCWFCQRIAIATSNPCMNKYLHLKCE